MKIKYLLKRTCLSLALLIGAGTAWGVEVTKTYVFTSKSWAATCNDEAANWTSGKDAGGFTAGQGIQVTNNVNYNGANATSPTSFSNISKIVVTYNTNKSTGNGSIDIKIGENAVKSNDVEYSGSGDGRSANYTTQFDYTTAQTGSVNITVNTVTNSIWLYSIAITYDDSDTDAPVFTSTYPKITNKKTTSVDLLVKANETCKVYYMAVAAGADAPTANEIIANDSISCSANAEQSATISGLTKASAYDIYVIAKDNAGNVQATKTKIANVTTESREISSVSAPAKLYTGESATITWTTDGIAADANVKIELCKTEGNEVIVASTANDGTETISVPTVKYDDKYKIRVSLVESSTVYCETNALAIIPNLTINKLLTDTVTDGNKKGKSIYEGQTIRVKGLVTGIKTQSTDYRNLILQNGNGKFSTTYIFSCDKDNGTSVALGDSIYAEGGISYYNGLLEIGSSNNHAIATIINHDNDLPEPVIVSIKDAKSKAYINRIVKLEGVTYTGKSLKTSPTDSIKTGNNMVNYMNNGALTGGNVSLTKNRKYDIIGAVSYNNDYQIWPRTKDTAAVSYKGKDRTYVIRDIYLYSNDISLSTFTINGRSAVGIDTMYITNFSTCKGITAAPTNAKATVSNIKVNGATVAASEWGTKQFAENDTITITVTAEDGTVGTHGVRLLKDQRSFSFAALSTTTFSTGNTINLTWTQQKVDNINIYFETGDNLIKLNASEFAANGLSFNYTVANSINGTGKIKAIASADNYVLDSIAITINDTQAPTANLKPANGATGIATSVSLILNFDEAVTLASDAKIKANNIEAKLVQAGDSTVKAYFAKLDYDTEYTVTLPAGSISDAAGNNPTLSWKFTTRPQPEPELYFSEYCHGSNNNKYLEIYNPKDENVDLSNYIIISGYWSKSGNYTNPLLKLKGILASESVYVITFNQAKDSIIKAVADTIVSSNVVNFTGDDALKLCKVVGNDTIELDIFGTFGIDPGDALDVAGIKDATKDHTLVRKDLVCGSTDWAEQAGTDSLDSQWIVAKDCDDFSNIGIHSIGHRANASSFNIAEADNAAVIDKENHTITIEAVYGTDLTAIKPQLTLSRGATATINGVAYTNGASFDFSQPAKLVITSEDGETTLEWTITISVAALPSTAAEIRTFAFNESKAQKINIDADAATISATMDYGTDITALTPVFTISAAASVSATTMIYIDSLNAYSYSAPINFSNPLKIKVNAQDPTVSKEWTISVGVVQPEALSIYQIQYSTKDTSAYINKFVSTEGVITSLTASGSGFEIYIQDSAKAWNGVLVYDETGVAKDAKLGDNVKVIGTVTEYFTITEIKIVAIEVLSSGNSIEPIILTAEDAKNEAYESVLVTIKNMTCKEGSGNTFTAEDDTDNLQVYNKYKFDGFAMEVDSVYDVTGIMYYYSSSKSYEIIPRSTADIVKIEKEYNGGNGDDDEGGNGNNSAVDETVANVVSIAAYDLTIVVENANADIAVFDISGRMVAKRAANSNRIELQLPKAGLYIVKVGTTSQKVVLK